MSHEHPGLYRRPSHQGQPYESPRPPSGPTAPDTPLHRADPSLMKRTPEPGFEAQAQRRRAGVVWATPTELASRANTRIASGLLDLSLASRTALVRSLRESPGQIRDALDKRQARLTPSAALPPVVPDGPTAQPRSL